MGFWSDERLPPRAAFTPRPPLVSEGGRRGEGGGGEGVLGGRRGVRDNLDSMKADNVMSGSMAPELGIVPTALEAIAPQYLAANG
ncbi:MAG: hypothetical protein NVSMB6_28860 [Burkholderiaceae bacterium]